MQQNDRRTGRRAAPGWLVCLCLCLGLNLAQGLLYAGPAPAKPRLLATTDIGGDPDDQQSLIRLLLYANEFKLEGLVASASGTPDELGTNVVRPDLIRRVVEAYGQVRPNLALHAPGYPPLERLRAIIKAGNPRRGTNYLGQAHDTEGSRWILTAARRADPRPLNVAIWGGSTDLAQALWRARHELPDREFRRLLGRLRVHAIGHQDNTGPWILENFPQLFYVLSMGPEGRDRRLGAYRGMYLGGDESLTSRAWVDEHVRNDHGPLGALYPVGTWTAPNPHSALKEGDTPSWFFFLPNGLGDPAHPEWGGWGGRFARQRDHLYRDAADTVAGVTDPRAAVWRWRPAFQADFQARLDWCVRPAKRANHSPIAVVNGDTSQAVVHLRVASGKRLRLSAVGSRDPDGDSLRFEWACYPEAGTFAGRFEPEPRDAAVLVFQAPAVSREETIHLILAVRDSGAPSLTAFRRVVVHVRP